MHEAKGWREPYPLMFRMTGAADSVVLESVPTYGSTLLGTPALDEAVAAAVAVCEAQAGPVSMRRLIELMDVKARRETKIAAIEEAVARGQIAETAGPRNSRQFTIEQVAP